MSGSKGLSILPMWVADHGVAIAFYYEDPDQNVVELNINNYGEAWTATEMLKTAPSATPAQVDPEKMVAAREAGASPWEFTSVQPPGNSLPRSRSLQALVSEPCLSKECGLLRYAEVALRARYSSSVGSRPKHSSHTRIATVGWGRMGR